MQIFAGSVRQAADTFLHAGYISAQPSSMALEYPPLLDTTDTGYAVSLDAAFRLSETAGADAAMTGWLAGWEGLIPALLPAMAALTTAIAAVLLLRMASDRARATARGFVAVALTGALSVGTLGACVGVPWEDVDPEDFDDPRVATVVLMYSVVKEALLIHHSEVGPAGSLAAVEDSVALPVAEPTDGVAYALAAYGRDGWANELQLEDEAEGIYLISSGGEDGSVGGTDDLALQVDVADVYGPNRTYYLKRDGDTLWLYIRAMPEAWGSNELDGAGDEAGYVFDDQFYAVPMTVEYLEQAWMSHDSFEVEIDWPTTVEAIESFYAGFVTQEDPEPLVVQIFAAEAVDAIPQ